MEPGVELVNDQYQKACKNVILYVSMKY